MTPEIKETIVLAAQAMGGYAIEELEKTTGGLLAHFNPLTSPADSHVLMCELEIDVKWNKWRQVVTAIACIFNAYGKYERIESIEEPYTTDKVLACRLAILRAAAEIGRGRRTHDTSTD